MEYHIFEDLLNLIGSNKIHPCFTASGYNFLASLMIAVIYRTSLSKQLSTVHFVEKEYDINI